MWFFPSRERHDVYADVCTFSIQEAKHGRPRAQILVGRNIMREMGWSNGKDAPTRVIVGFGEPGSEHYGWIILAPDPKGYALRAYKPGVKSGYFQTQMLADWVTQQKHEASHCKWRKSDAAVEIELPAWALKQYAATKHIRQTKRATADKPHTAAAGTPAAEQPLDTAQAGGSGRSSPDAPPAEIQSPGADGREPVFDGAATEAPVAAEPSETSQPAAGQLYSEASSGNGREPSSTLGGSSADRDAIASEVAPRDGTNGDDRTAGREAATASPATGESAPVAPAPKLSREEPVWNRVRRLIYAELVRTANAGETTPSYGVLADAAGVLRKSSDVGNALQWLQHHGFIKNVGIKGWPAWQITENGACTTAHIPAPAGPVAARTAPADNYEGYTRSVQTNGEGFHVKLDDIVGYLRSAQKQPVQQIAGKWFIGADGSFTPPELAEIANELRLKAGLARWKLAS